MCWLICCARKDRRLNTDLRSALASKLVPVAGSTVNYGPYCTLGTGFLISGTCLKPPQMSVSLGMSLASIWLLLRWPCFTNPWPALIPCTVAPAEARGLRRWHLSQPSVNSILLRRPRMEHTHRRLLRAALPAAALPAALALCTLPSPSWLPNAVRASLQFAVCIA